MPELRACPVCNKSPQIRSNVVNDGASIRVSIQCKPFLRKEHCSAQSVNKSRHIALNNAVRIWNARAEVISEHIVRRRLNENS